MTEANKDSRPAGWCPRPSTAATLEVVDERLRTRARPGGQAVDRAVPDQLPDGARRGPWSALWLHLSLHHVADLEEVLDRLGALLVPGGTLVVVEWAWERFDEPTARWCFDRLPPPTPGKEPGWLPTHQERWTTSGQPWDAYFRAWAEQEGLQLAARSCGDWTPLHPQFHAEGPNYFADLANTTEAEEQAAIDAGLIRPGGIRYAATRP